LLTQVSSTGLRFFAQNVSFFVKIILLSFSSGIPFLLTLSTLSVWLSELGIRPSVIGLMALSTLPYCLKFVWGTVLDHLSIPYLSRWLGRRRSWALFSQLCLFGSIIAMGSTSPEDHLFWTSCFALMVCLFAALQDVIVEAYRIEITPKGLEGSSASATYLGFRLGMMASGAGALYLASWLSWFHVYALMACCLSVGMITCLLSKDPPASPLKVVSAHPKQGALPGSLPRGKPPLLTSFQEGIQALFDQYDWRIVCGFILLYKVGDTVLNVMNTPFLLSIGFSKLEIAQIAKFFGISAMICGGFFGGLLLNRFGIITGLLLCSALQILSCLMFFIQSLVGYNLWILTIVIGAENFTCGLGASAFIAYISSLCMPGHTALHFAVLTSIASLMRILLSGIAGIAADFLSWSAFFLLASLCCVPSMLFLFRYTAHFQNRFEQYQNQPVQKIAVNSM
jgi:MFS transporter, PAT family, beta-lactamase induction signal transducer AmpG